MAMRSRRRQAPRRRHAQSPSGGWGDEWWESDPAHAADAAREEATRTYQGKEAHAVRASAVRKVLLCTGALPDASPTRDADRCDSRDQAVPEARPGESQTH